ncbi:MAG: DEAD/DEAH box helicase [Bacteriovoracaceae bacterium]|jgi:SNF2 family DNA or RNA helicase|nr:DEAD/DEAH box helicase [Bacteriovoracaceae bacterium]
MNLLNFLNEKDIEFVDSFFPKMTSIKAKKLFENANTNISFQKGSTQRYFIISGIVNDGNTAEARVSFKRSDEYPDGKITSSCTCTSWNDETHCEHIATLMLKFVQTDKAKKQFDGSSDSFLKASVAITGSGVHTEEYGTVLTNANKLIGARPNSTYSSIQYILTNKKVINFPIAKKFEDKIIINFVSASSIDKFKDLPHAKDNYFPIFSISKDGKESKKISVFESLYLFNWETGETFSQPSEFSQITKLFLIDGFLNKINDFYKMISSYIDNENIIFQLDGKEFSQIEYDRLDYRLSISSSDRKSFLNLDLEIFDSKQRVIKIPDFFDIMICDGGLLDSFRTKSASFEFIKHFCESLEYNTTEYKKFIYSSNKRKQILTLIDYILDNESLINISPTNECMYFTENKRFLSIYSAIYKCFGENSSRYSFKVENSNKLRFQIPKNQLLNGISAFYKLLSAQDISIFYNQTEIKTWNSNIKFEREKSNLNWFDLSLVVTENDFEIIKNAKVTENFILTNTGLVILDSKEKELLKFMKKYTIHEKKDQEVSGDNLRKFSLNFKRARIFELFELKKHGINGALTPEEEILCENLVSLKEMPNFDIPTRYHDISRSYQNDGYNWLRFLYENRFGACLADDMGLGKTLQTIMFLESIIDKIERVLIVCPVSILFNWQNEINKFSDIDVQVYYGNDRAKELNKKVILTSYGIMKKESYTTFNDINFDIIIMDEVQNLKNIRSQGAIAARNLKGDFRICITGTPVENDLSEFYNIMDLSIPGIWGEANFLKTTSTKKSRLLARKTVRPFILRRTKDQVLTELPEKVENHIYLDFEESERQHYVATLATIKKNMENVQKGRKYTEILKSLLQLRQLCLWQNDKSVVSTKINFLMESLEQIIDEGHKVLVFSQFTTYLDIIQNKVRERSWKFARIDGSQTLKTRSNEVSKFQEGDASIFLISLKAGGVGLNLTAASYIFLMDPWWNPAVENQAIDRAYRIGQKNKLTVYRPIIKNSVEEKVLVLQNTKKELFKDLMAEDDDKFFNGKLNMQDFQEILG